MPICEVFELLDYLADYPPAHVILRAVHLDKPKDKASARGQLRADEDETRKQMGGLQQILGTAPERVPAHLAEMAEWAEALRGKLPN